MTDLDGGLYSGAEITTPFGRMCYIEFDGQTMTKAIPAQLVVPHWGA